MAVTGVSSQAQADVNPPATMPPGRTPDVHHPAVPPWEPVYRFTVLFLLPLCLYLVLAAGSGNILGLWSWPEIFAAILIGLLCARGARRVAGRDLSTVWLDPIRWCAAVVYLIGPFLYALIKANLEVLWCIVTGRIQPAIVRIEPGIDSPMGLYLLANCITLSPGTLTLVVDEDEKVLYVHCLNWKTIQDREAATRAVAGSLLPWVRWLSRPRRVP